ncbi:hypothetical protein [Sinorhizobium psoraleae]|uniref:Uncharacterized protein n=1 Tax=Sinorhizobium psoraleae TaxID=520838 RepID=A0ABT4KA52_9HYPH|nr:hypothetical protein [Sinorhizobium psoraleae]MCZ4088840.1 hypothetical protein [Sinorhizobium psoraleae]
MIVLPYARSGSQTSLFDEQLPLLVHGTHDLADGLAGFEIVVAYWAARAAGALVTIGVDGMIRASGDRSIADLRCLAGDDVHRHHGRLG